MHVKVCRALSWIILDCDCAVKKMPGMGRMDFLLFVKTSLSEKAAVKRPKGRESLVHADPSPLVPPTPNPHFLLPTPHQILGSTWLCITPSEQPIKGPGVGDARDTSPNIAISLFYFKRKTLIHKYL